MNALNPESRKKVPKWKTKGTSLEAGNCKVISNEEKWEAYLLERRVFEKILEEEAVEITKKAITFAKHANRKKITSADVELAIKEFS